MPGSRNRPGCKKGPRFRVLRDPGCRRWGLGKTPGNNVPWVEAVVEHLRISCERESCCKTTRGAKPFINPRPYVPYVFGTPGLDFSPVWFRALGLGPWRLVACKALVLRGRRLWFCVHSNLVLNFQSKAQTRRRFSTPSLSSFLR